MKSNILTTIQSEIIIPVKKGILKIPLNSPFITLIDLNIFSKNKLSANWTKLTDSKKVMIFLNNGFSIKVIIQEFLQNNGNDLQEISVLGYDADGNKKVITSTIRRIEALLLKENISQPETILVGDINILYQHSYFKSKPLWGKKIVTTRSHTMAYPLVRDLENLGAQVLEFPLIDLQLINNYEQIKKILSQIETYQWIIFGMNISVDYFTAYLLGMGYDLSILQKCKIAALSLESLDQLAGMGLDIHYVLNRYDADLDQVIAGLQKSGINKEQPVLVVVGDKKGKLLKEKLEKLEVNVSLLPLLQAKQIHIDQEKLTNLINFFPIDLWIFNSPFINRLNFFWQEIHVHLKQCAIAAIGSSTHQAVEAEGLSVDISPKDFTIPSLVQAILDYYENQEQVM